MKFLHKVKQWDSRLMIFILSLFISTALYWRVPFTFFQQDEWQGFGHMISQKTTYFSYGLSPLKLLFAYGRPLTNVINYFLFTTIPYDMRIPGVFYILLHAINSVLVYILALKLIKNKSAAFFSFLFFSTSSLGYQAIAWPGNSTPLAGLFILLSLIKFLDYMNLRKHCDYYWSLGFLFISFYLKEIALIFLPVYLFINFLLTKNKKTFFIQSPAIIMFGYFSLFVFYRLYLIINASHKMADFVHKSTPFKSTIIVNSFLYIITAFSQMLIPPTLAFKISEKFLKVAYPSLYTSPIKDLISQTVVTDLIMTILSFFFILLVFSLYVRYKINKIQILSPFVIIAVSIIPYTIIIRGDSYLESRYYYLALAGMSLFISMFFMICQKYIKEYTIYLFIIISLVYLFIHIPITYNSIYQQQKKTLLIKRILQDIKQVKGVENKKVVFYITSNNNYFVDNNPLPFQQGIGYTLLVWTNSNSKYKLRDLINNNFLWDLGTEGYKDYGDQGFGYFYSIKDLKIVYKEYNLSSEDLISLYWNDKKQKFIDNKKDTLKLLE